MDINAFRAELETRLLIEKVYIIQELDSIKTYQERIELLPKFNKKYRLLIKRLADEEGLDLSALYQKESDSNSENLSNGQVILGVTMNIYDQMADDLYEKIVDTE